MPYEWEEWGLRALLGIEPYEVRQILDGKTRWPRPGTDPETGLPALTIWGRTYAGRPLIVAVHHVGASLGRSSMRARWPTMNSPSSPGGRKRDE